MSFTRQEIQQLLADVIVHFKSLAQVVTVLRSGGDPNGAVKKGLRPLHYATFDNNVACMAILVKFGADVNLDDDVGHTALHIAARKGYKNAVELLLRNGAITNYHDSENRNVSEKTRNLASLGIHPLNSALEYNHSDCADLILQYGCSPNNKYFLGHELNLVPLENLDCVEVLLRHGADPNAVSRGGLSALMKACRQKTLAAVKLLTRYNADVNQQCPLQFDHKQPLHFAIEAGDLEICRFLLENGATTSLVQDYKFSPLEAAIRSDKPAICELLLQHGANVNDINGDACTPLQVACSLTAQTKQREIIETLLNHGAAPCYSSPQFSCTEPCMTSLVEYIASSEIIDVDIIKLLVKHGAYVNFTLPTKIFKINDPHGILSYMQKIHCHPEAFDVLVSCAKSFDKKVLELNSTLSEDERQILSMESSEVRTLKHLCRHKIRNNLKLTIPESVSSLMLPLCLQQYLMFHLP